VGRKGFLDQAWRFLDHYVLGRDVPGQQSDPRITVQEADPPGKWRHEAQWPPVDAQPWKLPVRAGSYTDTQGNDAGSLATNGVWSITKQLAGDAHLAGEPALDVPVTTTAPGAHLVALLYDIDAAGTARFVQRGAMAIPGTGASRAQFKLYPQDWKFAAGHRIALFVGPGDDNWFSPGVTNTTVDVGAGTLSLPLLGIKRTQFVPGGASDGMSAVGTFAVPAATIAAGEVNGQPPAQVVP
jgi:predicted acyl esterase